MAKININLLPAEDALKQKREKRFLLVQRVSSALLVMLIFLTAVTFGLKHLQRQNIQNLQSLAQQEETKVANFKSKESALFVLKNRLTTISQVVATSGIQADIYDLVVRGLPPSVAVSSLSIDKAGNITSSLVFPDGKTFDELLSKLLSKAQKIEVESLSRGRDGIYRVSLKVQIK